MAANVLLCTLNGCALLIIMHVYTCTCILYMYVHIHHMFNLCVRKDLLASLPGSHSNHEPLFPTCQFIVIVCVCKADGMADGARQLSL